MHLPDRLHIAHDALVLEIGGGGDPHPRSTVLVDKYPGPDGMRQRGGDALEVGTRTLIQADGAHLPFRDGQFDYVIASHVIERVPTPDVFAFVRELQRVGARGYIEAPSIAYDVLRDVPEHVWLVHLADGTIHLAPRGGPEAWVRLHDPLFDDPGFRVVVERFADLFFVGMEWRKALGMVIHENVEDLVSIVPGGWASDAICLGNHRARERDRETRSIRRRASAAVPDPL